MVKIFLTIFLFFLIIPPQSLYAFEIAEDPQYVVINFSDSFHLLNWYAPEKEWKTKIKPKAVQRLRNMRALLTTGNTKDRRLAWSTLLEYTNYPLDTISDSSPYIIRIKRMMELAEEEDFPIFIPLNGVQWWDELPELWNWWDPDGNQTPGCTNDDYGKCAFAKLRNPVYRKRFIKGYNLDNKWNVDWSDWNTPMKFGTRNWGSGDILVAPSPNIVGNKKKVKATFANLQKSRYEAIIKTISSTLTRWETEKKQYLFAGISIGTEVTLNGALKSGDNEFRPYGFRAIQDTFCPQNTPTCGTEKNWSALELDTMRREIIHTYFNELSRTANVLGVPKQRVYTHVWSEAEPGETLYTNAIASSVTYFSRPGMSIYGKALNPLEFSLLKNMVIENGFPAWAAPEFAPLIRDDVSWHTALVNTLDNSVAPAKLIDVYNETDILRTPAIPQLKDSLMETPLQPQCLVDESVAITKSFTTNPQSLEWRFLGSQEKGEKNSVILWDVNTVPSKKNTNLHEYSVGSEALSFDLPNTLKRGFYYWAVKRSGCEGDKWTISTPHVFYYFPPLPETSVPKWVQIFQSVFK